jgi:hypothetical protein
MLKIATAGVTALFVTASPLAYAQTPSQTPSAGERISTADLDKLTDIRVNVVKAALQLTPDQEKYWPAVEDAIRARANNREARIAAMEKRVDELREGNRVEALSNRNPIDFLNRRANALAQRSADLKKLASAWEPLYKTLSQDQRQRMALLTIFALRDMRNVVEQRRAQSGEEEDEDEEN